MEFPHSHRTFSQRSAIGRVDHFAGFLQLLVADFELLDVRDLRLVEFPHQGEQFAVAAFPNPIDDLADHLFDVGGVCVAAIDQAREIRFKIRAVRTQDRNDSLGFGMARHAQFSRLISAPRALSFASMRS